jgi:hypothetical protein
VASASIFETKEVRQVLPGAKRADENPILPDESIVDRDIAEFPESVDDPIDQLPQSCLAYLALLLLPNVLWMLISQGGYTRRLLF